MTPEQAVATDPVFSGSDVNGENSMKPNILIAGCLALLMLCACAVAGVGAVELHAELDAAMDEWGDPEATPTTEVNLVIADEAEGGSTLIAEYTAATVESLQPLFKAPWEGQKTITQGVNGAFSHKQYEHYDNIYALDISGVFDVLAPYDGTVCYVDNTGGGSGGKQVAIKHTFEGREYITVYLHLSKIHVKTGTTLRQGQVFAVSGDTGEVTGPHLHFHMFKGPGQYDSHTQSIERLWLKRIGVDDDFRVYNMSNGDLDDSIIKRETFESDNVPISKEGGKTRDTVLVLDASGSMRGTPVIVMKDAAKIFCSEVLAASGENRVAIVVYTDIVEKTLDLTSDPDSLNSTIDSIQAGGGTNIGVALDSANSLLSSSDADTKNIILMTDGLPEHGKEEESGPYTRSDSHCYRQANYVYNKCSELKQKYNIYTLGFFHGLSGSYLEFGQKFLYDIQNKGYYSVTNADELKFIFGELAEEITKEDYPIIVVHGITGGKLYDGNELVWIEDLPSNIWREIPKMIEWLKTIDLSRLDIKNDLDTPDSRINLNAEGVEREYGTLDSYKELVDGLCEQFPDRAVYFFSYDWRQSNDDSAVKLNDLINDVKAQTEYSKVDLICHSMGGIVVSSYAKQYGTNDVRYIITLATPYEGAPDAIRVPLAPVSIVPNKLLESCLRMDILRPTIEDIGESLLPKLGLTKELIAGLPSIPEIIPTERYFESTEFLKIRRIEPSDMQTGFVHRITGECITYEEYCNIMRSIFGDDNYNSAVVFQDSIEDVLLNLDNTYFAVATGKETIAGIIINEKEPASLESIKVKHLDYTESDKKGDGTVPYLSATMNGSLPDEYGNEKDSAGNSRYREFGVDHGGIISHDNVLLWIKNILSQKSDPHEEFDIIDYRGYTVIRIACPIDVTIDVNGEILSSDPEMGLTYIPNGRLDFISDNGVVVCLEDTGTIYDISIMGTGEGTMDYDIDWYDPDNTLTEARSLYEVPITANTEITTNTDSTKPTVLNIDSDGDGVFDTQWSVDESGEVAVVDLKPTYTSYSDGGSDSPSSAITSGSTSFGRSAGVTGINFPDGVTGVVTLNDLTAEVIPPENTYAAFDISAPAFEGVAEIKFVIPSAILADSGYGRTDVVMKHYTNNVWQNLPTYFVEEERGAMRYIATATSFSPFAIVYETSGTTIADTGDPQETPAPDETVTTPTVEETQPVGEETAAPGVEQTTVSPSEETTEKTEATATKTPAPLIGMLLGLGAAALLRRRA